MRLLLRGALHLTVNKGLFSAGIKEISDGYVRTPSLATG